jgi:hypothetical protein
MKHKLFVLGFLLVALIGCASLRPDDPIEIYKRTQSYKNISFDEVWSAALRSIDETGFMVRSATKRSGLVQAVAKMNPDPQFMPPLMNIIIRDRYGRIEVNFHIEFPGQRDDKGKRRTHANRFFKALRKNLK